MREIAQTTLDKVRSLSQALHPVMLEEAGLESTLDWYLPMVERQTGIHISYEKSGTAFPVDGNAAIHVYRMVQEALNNVTRHSGAAGSLGAIAIFAAKPRTGSGRSRQRVLTQPQNRESDWWRCANARNCWAAHEFPGRCRGGTLVRLDVSRRRNWERAESHAE